MLPSGISTLSTGLFRSSARNSVHGSAADGYLIGRSPTVMRSTPRTRGQHRVLQGQLRQERGGKAARNAKPVIRPYAGTSEYARLRRLATQAFCGGHVVAPATIPGAV